MVAVSSGLIGPTRSRVLSPSRVTVWASLVWLEIVRRTGPAPNELGETVTLSFWITPESSSAVAGRGLFSKFSLPHPARAMRHTAPVTKLKARLMRIVLIATDPIPRGGTLAEPDGRPPPQHVLQPRLNAASHVVGKRLDERRIVGIVGSEMGDVDGLEELDSELRGEVHERRGEPEVWKRVADREVG